MFVLVLNGKLYRENDATSEVVAFGRGWSKLGEEYQHLLDRWDKMHKLAHIKHVFLKNGLYKVENQNFRFLIEAT